MAKPLERALAWMDRQLGRAAGLAAVIGALGIVGLMGIILIGVIWRYLLNNPIFGIEDLSVLVLSVVAACAVFYGARNEAHVSVNIIRNLLSRKGMRVTDLLMRLATLFALGVATYALFKKACGFEKACITENLSIEHWPFYYVLGVAMGLYGIHVLVRLIWSLQNWGEDDPDEARD